MKLKAEDVFMALIDIGYGVYKGTLGLDFSDCVIFRDGEAYTFNGKGMAATRLDVGFSGAVNYADFLTYIRTIYQSDGSAEVDISVDGGVLTIKRGRSTTKMPFCPTVPSHLDAIPAPSLDGWKILPQNFFDAVRKCEAIYVRSVESDNVLSCLNVTGEHIEAATPEQVIRANCKLDVPYRFLVKSGYVGKLFKSKVDKPQTYQIVKNWLFFHTGNTVYGMPVSDDPFVDIDRFLVSDTPDIEFPEPALLEVSVFRSFGEDARVMISFCGDTCKLSTKGKRGQHSTSFPLECPENKSYIIPVSLLAFIAKNQKCSFGDERVYVNTDGFQYTASIPKEINNAV